MNEALELCRRILGEGADAEEAAAQAHAAGGDDRIGVLAAAAQACRRCAESQELDPSEEPPDGLAEAVAREMRDATARLPERQREALALRELLRLSHQQISEVLGIDTAAVAPLLARARLGLRGQRRGLTAAASECAERDRAMRVLTCRQDSEPLSAENDAWLLAHLGTCEDCSQAHAAMLEASVCYRAWPAG